MKKIIFLCLMLVLLLALIENSFAAWKETDISKFVPLPPKIEIIPPPPDLPKEVAAFSGRWEGIWEGDVKSVLIVEKINLEEARCIYGWGRTSGAIGGYSRWKTKIFTGLKTKIEYSSHGQYGTTKFIFEMGEDLKTIFGLRQFEGRRLPYTNKIIMKKVEED